MHMRTKTFSIKTGKQSISSELDGSQSLLLRRFYSQVAGQGPIVSHSGCAG